MTECVRSGATGRNTAASVERDTVLKHRRPDELHFTTAIWGESEGVESRLRELMRAVRALRSEMATEREQRAFSGERRMPTREPLAGPSPPPHGKLR